MHWRLIFFTLSILLNSHHNLLLYIDANDTHSLSELSWKLKHSQFPLSYWMQAPFQSNVFLREKNKLQFKIYLQSQTKDLNFKREIKIVRILLVILSYGNTHFYVPLIMAKTYWSFYVQHNFSSDLWWVIISDNMCLSSSIVHTTILKEGTGAGGPGIPFPRVQKWEWKSTIEDRGRGWNTEWIGELGMRFKINKLCDTNISFLLVGICLQVFINRTKSCGFSFSPSCVCVCVEEGGVINPKYD